MTATPPEGPAAPTGDGIPLLGEEPAAPRDEMPAWVRKAIALFFVWAIGLWITYWLVGRLHTVLVMVLAALFLALSMEPPVNYLANRHGWRRGAATGLVLFGVLIIGFVFVAAIASIAVQEVSNLIDEAPGYVRDFERFANDELGLALDLDDLVHDLREPEGTIQDFGDELASGAFSITATAATVLLQVFTTLIFAFYLTADGPRLRRIICSLLPPERQRTVLHTWEVAIDKTGGYLYSRGIQAAISAAATWIVLLALGVPYSLALGLWVGVISQFIPTVGTYIAMVLPVFVALSRDPVDGLVVLAFLVLYQQFENYVLGPRITKRTMAVHPALAIGSVFVGAALLGPVGALLALPATAVFQALLSAYAQRYEVVHSELLHEPPPRPRRNLLRRGSGTGSTDDGDDDDGDDADLPPDEAGAGANTQS